MKRKYLLGIIIVLCLCFTLVGCKGNNKNHKNESFGDYTGVYQLGGVEIKVVHYDKKVLILVNKDGKLYGNTSLSFEGNTINVFDSKFEFLNQSLKISSNIDDITSGEYKKSVYSTDDIYKDYIGEISLLNSNYNGVYKDGKHEVFTVQINDNAILLFNRNGDVRTNLTIDKQEDDHFAVENFEDSFDLKYQKDTLELKVESQIASTKALTGKYTRKSKMSAEEVIQVFAFDFE